MIIQTRTRRVLVVNVVAEFGKLEDITFRV